MNESDQDFQPSSGDKTETENKSKKILFDLD